jgi:hypothetical protein
MLPNCSGLPKSSFLTLLMEHRYGPDDTTTHPEDGNYRQLRLHPTFGRWWQSLGLSHRVGAIQRSHGHKSQNRGECHDWQFAEEINDVIGDSWFILDVEVELLQVCGPLLMAVILQFSFCRHELQWLMISVDECLLPKNVMSPLAASFHNGVHFFVIIMVLTNNI